MGDLRDTIDVLVRQLGELHGDELMDAVNTVRSEVHKVSPMAAEPVDCVLWVKSGDVVANDYNPNKVAPPEMRLLEHSISCDGYTQPIVAYGTGGVYEVVDGFHRNRVGKESKAVRARVNGRLPVVIIRESQSDENNRVASTIRHNRARGKHEVTAMSDIVRDLTKRNWTESRISKELGMDMDEVLRLKQITGLAELFADREFSAAWEVD